MLKILDSTAPESKEEGLDVPLNDEMQDVNGVRYKAIRSTKRTCNGCCFSNRKNVYGVMICSRVRCAWMFRADRKDVVFITTSIPQSMKSVFVAVKKNNRTGKEIQ